MSITDDKIHEECGVFGIWDSSRFDVAHDIYYGLVSLQHRGQESAGIAVCDTEADADNIGIHKGMGLVSEVFGNDMINSLKGNIGIGHVRYSTTGASNIQNVQPIVSYYLKGTLSLVHNGNIVNSRELKKELMNEGVTFKATSDSEVIHSLISRMRACTGSINEAVKMAVRKLIGGYALVIMSPRKLVAVRDPLGLKPLCLGKTKTGYIVASENCALHAIGAEFIRDVRPGEIITISEAGIESDTELCGTGNEAHCVFEYIYFARLDSKLDGVSVYSARFKGGRALARAYPADADIVVGVPESGMTAAAGYAYESGIRYAQAFHKNSYIGRTFIKPTQQERENAVHMKLNVLDDVVRGQRVVLIDDSIVRGTTIANLIKNIRRAGAKEVHVRICSPQFLYPCYYGTDVPDKKQLIANNFTVEEIRKRIGADSLGYMRLQDLEETVDGLPLCKACFEGRYPTKINEPELESDENEKA